MKRFKPVSKGSRIEVVDALRGFALLGVLLANIPYGGEPPVTGFMDDTLRFLTDLLISKKFITIFSILFGFGFYIQMSRAGGGEGPFTKYFIRRMALLFLIGTVHCFLLWNGDILMSYAFGGFILLLIRNWSVKRLLILAVVFNVLLTGIVFIGNSALEWQVYDYDYGLAHEWFVVDSYGKYLEINYIMAPWVNFFKDMPITLIYTFGNMLLGMIIGKLDLFRNPPRLRRIRTIAIVLGFSLGLASSYFFHQVMTGALELDIPMLWVPFALAAGMILQSLGYMALFAYLYTLPWTKKLLGGFRYVGKTALSNYLLQTVFYLVVFFSWTHGPQLYGKLTLAQTFGIALVFFAVQSVLSFLWLKKKDQGPVEYLWKKLSYPKKPKLQDEKR